MIPVHWTPLSLAVQPLIPSTDLGDWEDPNGIVTSVTVTGNEVEITLGSPAASRDLPHQGGAFVFPLRNLFGDLITGVSPVLLHPILLWDTATALEADVGVSIVPINADTVAAASLGTGWGAAGNGTGVGPDLFYYAAGWNTNSAVVYDATARCLTGSRRIISDTMQGGMGAYLSDGNGAYLTQRGNANNYTAYPATHLALCANWVAGTGTAGATARFRAYMASALAKANACPGAT